MFLSHQLASVSFFFFLSHRMSVQLSLLTFKLLLFLCRSNVYVCYFAFAPCKQSNRALFPGRRGEGGLEEVAFLSLSVSCLYLDLSSPLFLLQALSLSQSGRIRTKHKVNSAGVGHSNEWLCVNVNIHTELQGCRERSCLSLPLGAACRSDLVFKLQAWLHVNYLATSCFYTRK